VVGVRYTARLGLIPGHVAGQVYYLPLEFVDAQRTRDVDRDQRVTLSGRRETRHHRTDTLHRLTFRCVQGVGKDQLDEFLRSVVVGDSYQVWTHDDAPMLNLLRVDEAHAWRPFLRTGVRLRDWMQASTIIGREV